ncbi:hypothetical protein ACFVQ3_02050 [Oerskovia sp. NPDC057915]|uniref:hypothetical protein n=1 Tax=Oerskovia sp. NPDC057915 TaxID=3346280 RepID=UPI0036DAA929
MASNTSLTGAALVLVLALAVGGCAVDDQGTPGALESTGTVPTEIPPTETATDAATDPPDLDPTTPTPTAPVESEKPVVGSVGVLISNSAWDATTGVIVRGYADTVDAAATCTLELTKAGTTRTVTSEALESPKTMSCGELVVGPGDLSSGAWTAVLSYESTTAWGTSDPVVVNVP